MRSAVVVTSNGNRNTVYADTLSILPSGCLELVKGRQVVVIYNRDSWVKVEPHD